MIKIYHSNRDGNFSLDRSAETPFVSLEVLKLEKQIAEKQVGGNARQSTNQLGRVLSPSRESNPGHQKGVLLPLGQLLVVQGN